MCVHCDSEVLTAEILAVPDALTDIREAKREIDAGDYVEGAEAIAALRPQGADAVNGGIIPPAAQATADTPPPWLGAGYVIPARLAGFLPVHPGGPGDERTAP